MAYSLNGLPTQKDINHVEEAYLTFIFSFYSNLHIKHLFYFSEFTIS